MPPAFFCLSSQGMVCMDACQSFLDRPAHPATEVSICNRIYPIQTKHQTSARTSTPPLHPVELPGVLYLVPRLLSAHRQPHGVPPPPHGADVS